MNKYETAKSIILTVLVVASVFFSYNIWTYESTYETLERKNYIKEVSISEKEVIENIIKPSKVLYHHSNDHYGTDNPQEINGIMNYLSTSDYYNFQDISDTVSKDEFYSFVHGKGRIEINFPTLIPIEQLKNVVPIIEKKLPSFTFDTIVINIDDRLKEDGKINFVSYEDRTIYSSNVSVKLLTKIVDNFYTKAAKHPRYISYDTGQKLLFLEAGQPTFKRNKYFLNLINVDLFKDALFTNPNVVQKTYLTTEDEYTDTTTMMTANYSTRVLSFVNPTAEANVSISLNDLIEKSVSFLNDHSGWTDNYNLVVADDQKTVFRLNVGGKQVFNDSGMSEIVQIWGDNTIFKYNRPYFTLDILLVSETEEITLPSGEDVISYLENEVNFNYEFLEDLVPAYSMIKDRDEPRIIILEPMWYYRYNGVWGRITSDDLGGRTSGLE